MTRLVSLAAVLILTACSTVSVNIPVMKPAEINVARYRHIGVDRLQNDYDQTISNMLKTKLVESNRFVVLDRQNMGRVNAELERSAGVLADSTNGPQLGKQLTAAALVLGAIEAQDYNENVEKYEYETKNQKGQVTRHVTYTRKGRAVVRVTFQVTDVETSQVIKAKQIEHVVTDSTSATDQYPRQLNREGMLQNARQQVVEKFVKAITPHSVNMSVSFLKDGKLPQLEAAVNLVKAGQYEDAEKMVTEAIELAEKGGLPPKTVSKAYWNRGLIREYSGQFEAARADVKKAFQYDANEDYLAELGNIATRESDEKKLKEQTGPAAATAETGEM